MSKTLRMLLLPALLAACADAEPPAPAVPGPRIVDEALAPLDLGERVIDLDSAEYRGMTPEEVLRRVTEEQARAGVDEVLDGFTDGAPDPAASMIRAMTLSSEPGMRKQGLERLIEADDEVVEWLLEGVTIGPKLPADEALLLLTAIARPGLRVPRTVTDGLAAAPAPEVRIRAAEFFATVDPPADASRELAKMLDGEPDGSVRQAIRDALQAVARRR